MQVMSVYARQEFEERDYAEQQEMKAMYQRMEKLRQDLQNLGNRMREDNGATEKA